VTSTTEYLADAGRCTPGSTLDAAKIQIDALEKLAAAQVYENHAVSTHVFEENKAHGAASTVLLKSAVPTGDITFDEGGGVATFFAVRTTTQRWRENSSAKIENFQYRITADAGVTYRFPVPGNAAQHYDPRPPRSPQSLLSATLSRHLNLKPDANCGAGNRRTRTWCPMRPCKMGQLRSATATSTPSSKMERCRPS
jgi:hypothetical protein